MDHVQQQHQPSVQVVIVVTTSVHHPRVQYYLAVHVGNTLIVTVVNVAILPMVVHVIVVFLRFVLQINVHQVYFAVMVFVQHRNVQPVTNVQRVARVIAQHPTQVPVHVNLMVLTTTVGVS
jgi:hypothetical protein